MLLQMEMDFAMLSGKTSSASSVTRETHLDASLVDWWGQMPRRSARQMDKCRYGFWTAGTCGLART